MMESEIVETSNPPFSSGDSRNPEGRGRSLCRNYKDEQKEEGLETFLAEKLVTLAAADLFEALAQQERYSAVHLRTSRPCGNFYVDVRSDDHQRCRCGHLKVEHRQSVHSETPHYNTSSKGFNYKWHVEMSTETSQQQFGRFERGTRHLKEHHTYGSEEDAHSEGNGSESAVSDSSDRHADDADKAPKQMPCYEEFRQQLQQLKSKKMQDLEQPRFSYQLRHTKKSSADYDNHHNEPVQSENVNLLKEKNFKDSDIERHDLKSDVNDEENINARHQHLLAAALAEQIKLHEEELEAVVKRVEENAEELVVGLHNEFCAQQKRLESQWAAKERLCHNDLLRREATERELLEQVKLQTTKIRQLKSQNLKLQREALKQTLLHASSPTLVRKDDERLLHSLDESVEEEEEFECREQEKNNTGESSENTPPGGEKALHFHQTSDTTKPRSEEHMAYKLLPICLCFSLIFIWWVAKEVRGHNSQIENSTQLGEYFEKVNENSNALLSNFHEALRLYVFSAVSAVAKQVRVVIDNKTLFAASAIMKSVVHYFEECWERFYIFFLS